MAAPDINSIQILRGLLDSLQQGVCIFSADRKLLYINPAMASVTGGGEKSVGGSLSELAKRHRLRTEDGTPLEPKDFPIERAFAGHETRDESYLYVSASGQSVWLSVTCICVRGDDGGLQYVIATITDISARKSREDKLRFMVESAKILSITSDFHERLREKAKLTVPSLADWCAIDLLDGDTTKRVVVVHRDQSMIDHVFEIQKRYPPDPQSPNSVYSTIKNQTPVFIPTVTDELLEAAARSPRHRDDIARLSLSSIMTIPIVAQGKGLGAMTLAYAESGRHYTEDDLEFFKEFCAHVGVVLDNAELYQAIQRRDEAKDVFLASLSHELRNPLAPIKSALEILKIRDVAPEVREELDVIEHQFDHMARLLNDLLDVTRFTHAKISIAPTRVELRRMVERALKASDPLLRNADITLHFTYPSAHLEVSADETRIEQAISNLMSNAIKFTPAGGAIWVDILKEGSDAIIRVRDNGAGIHASDLPNIFDMYYQGGYTRGYASSGLGIGLLLVRRIIDLHGGSIEAASEGLGKGCVFTIRLPLVEASRATPVDRSDDRRSADGKRILVVDDNVQAADSMAKLLTKLGAHADSLYSAEEALAHDLAAYDLMLLDVGMPRIDGYQLAKAVRNRGILTPLIALTGYGMAEDKQRALQAGFDAHLTKPVGIKELTGAIASVV